MTLLQDSKGAYIYPIKLSELKTIVLRLVG